MEQSCTIAASLQVPVSFYLNQQFKYLYPYLHGMTHCYGSQQSVNL